MRVLEFAQGVAGPACGRLFAGLGHEVIKCEPAEGDTQRHAEPLGEDGRSLSFAVLNPRKRSVIVGGDAGSRETVRALLATADVAIVGAADQTLCSIGLDPARIHDEWPQLVVVVVSGFGLDTPFSRLPDDCLLAEAFSGLAAMIGVADRQPLCLGGDQSAHASAFVAFFGAMLALQRRRHTGSGDLIDVAMCDVAAYMDWKSDVAYAVNGAIPARGGKNPWKLIRAEDGWIGLVYRNTDWPAIAELVGDERLGDERLRDELQRSLLEDEWLPVFEEWASTQRKKDVYARAQRLGLPFGYCADIADIAGSPQLLARDFIGRVEGGGLPRVGPPWRSRRLSWHVGSAPGLGEHTRAVMAEQRSAGAARLDRSPIRDDVDRALPPLDGIIVLDLGTITAGAATGRLLADYGATVVKVESADHPDSFRAWLPPGSPVSDDPAIARGVSPMFESNNAGKLGIEIDLRKPGGREIFLGLASRAHVLVENFRVGVTSRLGIDFESLRQVNPDIIYLSMSSQGQDGPEAAYTSYGSTLDVLSGLAYATGYDPEQPVWSSADVNYPDQVVSVVGAALIAYCIVEDVGGVRLDVSQREVVSWTLADQIASLLMTGRAPAPTGNRRPDAVPRDVYPCIARDQWVAIACRTDEQRHSLGEVLGADFGARPEGWSGEAAETADHAIAAWTSSRARAHCVEALTRAGVPCVPVLSAADRLIEPRFSRRRVMIPGRQGAPPRKGFPLVMREYTPPAPTPAPVLGAHTEIVLNQCSLVAGSTAGMPIGSVRIGTRIGDG